METSIYFDDATKAIRELYATEFKTLSSGDVDRLLNIFYRLVRWEEEGEKIRPMIMMTNNIGCIVKNIPDTVKIPFYIDEKSVRFNERLKALMCFCKSGWTVYINYGSDTVEYGLIKAINSIKDKSLEAQIFDENKINTISAKAKLVYLNVLSNGVVSIKGVKGSIVNINFSVEDKKGENWDDTIKRFVNDSVSKLKTTQRKLDGIKNILENIFDNCFKSLRGTICLIVDKDFKDSKGIFSDGTWLPEPIQFGKLFLQSKSFNESKLRAFADVFTTMLNYDGITILDNQGRIRAYNVFIESNNKVVQHIVGGARIRAAYTLLNTSNKRIIGVYFQSHDGGAFYKSSADVRRELTRAQKDAEKTQSYKQIEMPIGDNGEQI